MVITTNHAPKMFQQLLEHQAKVNAGGERNRYFFLAVSHPLFGRRALKRLVDAGKVEISATCDGDCTCRVKGE